MMISARKLKKEKMKLLHLKENDKLAFVHETLYNTGPVKIIRKSLQDGSISASYQKFFNLLFKVSDPSENLKRLKHSQTVRF